MSVPTKSFQQLLFSIARRIGQFDSGAVSNAAISGDLTDLVNAAMHYAWQFHFWPDALQWREETITTHPTVSGAYYVPRSSATRTLAAVKEVWSADPRTRDTKAYKLKYRREADGLYFYDSSLSTVWVHYRPSAPEYTDTIWVTATPYVVDDLRLYTDGHVYRCLTAHTSNASFAADLAAEKWILVPVLDCLFETVKQGVISHYKRYQSGQPVTAKSFEELMLDQLEHEIRVLQNQGT